MSEVRDSFAREAVFFQSREDFDDYMKSMENNFYETANLPKSPYQISTTNPEPGHSKFESNVLPTWPPKPNSFRGASLPVQKSKTGHNADDFINELITLN